MKVGILTFHNALNYGAVLQAYATQELLKSMGHTVEIIDYHNLEIDVYYKKYEFSWHKLITLNPKFFLKNLIVPRLYNKRKLRYNEFLNHLKISSPVKEGENLSCYDAVLIGSDQVWSIKHTGGFDIMYWGNFPCNPRTKKIAWSVCMGDAGVRDNDGTIADYLNNFSSISVRELSLKNYLNSISNKDVALTLDPTLAVNKVVWNTFLHPVKEHDYILVYAVKFLPETIAVAKGFSKAMKKKVIVVSAYSGRPMGHNVKQSCGPQDFLSYIKYASFVVTSSFHGTVFSLLFEKEFVSVVPEGKSNIRVEDLMNSLQLSDRIIRSSKGEATFTY